MSAMALFLIIVTSGPTVGLLFLIIVIFISHIVTLQLTMQVYLTFYTSSHIYLLCFTLRLKHAYIKETA